jgi:signal transduction histidine kinase
LSFAVFSPGAKPPEVPQFARGLAAVAYARSQNALQRLAACLIVAAIATSMLGNFWPALWFLGLVPVLLGDRAIFRWLAKQIAAEAAAPMPKLIVWMVGQSTYANIMAALLWFAPEGPGMGLALMYMCAGLANAAATLRSSPTLALAGAGPTIACFILLPLAEFILDGAQDTLLLMPLVSSLLLLGFGANLWRSLAASDLALAQAEAASIRERRAEAAAAATRADTLNRLARDLRTPDAALREAADAVLNSNAAQNAPVAGLLQASEVLAAAVADAVAPQVPKSAPTDLRMLLRGVAGVFRTRMKEKRLELFVDVSAATPALVYLDSVALCRILYHLLDNAIRHTAHGGVRIRLRVARADTDDAVRLEVLVADTGAGLSRAQLALLFSGAEEDAGGVAASIRLARALGGELSAQSELGEGALFKLAFTAALVAPRSNEVAA